MLLFYLIIITLNIKSKGIEQYFKKIWLGVN